MSGEVVVTPPAPPGYRRILAQIAVGAALGFGTWSFGGPAVIGWWYEPPIKDAFSCASSVRAAIGEFVKYQLIFAAIGGAMAVTIVFFAKRALRNRAAAKAGAKASG